MLRTCIIYFIYAASSKQRTTLRRSVSSEKKKLCSYINDYNALGATVEGFHETSIEAIMEGDFPWSRLTGLPIYVCMHFLLKSERRECVYALILSMLNYSFYVLPYVASDYAYNYVCTYIMYMHNNGDGCDFLLQTFIVLAQHADTSLHC